MLQSCDTMVALSNATKNSQTIFAKNSDRPADECQPLVLHNRQSHGPNATLKCQFLKIPQAATTYRHVGSRPYWCWGYEHGFNEHQVVIGNEALHSKLPPFTGPKLIGMEILRLGLERARTAAEAVETMTGLIGRYGQGKFENEAGVRTYDNGYIIADPREAYVLETAGHEWAVKQVEHTVGISNVYSLEADWRRLSPSAEAYAIEQGWWSAGSGPFNFADAYTANDRTSGSGAMRRMRSCAVLEHRRGMVDARTMINLLSDHGPGQAAPEAFQTTINPGTGICVHSNPDGSGGNTAASLVADLCADGSRLPVYWCGFYSPCLALFLPIFVEGELPPILSAGGQAPDRNSPWWQFYQLSRVARAGAARNVPVIRERWATFQNEMFESAYQLAVEGKRLSDEGETAAAAQLLTGYMANNTHRMMNELEALLLDLQESKMQAVL